VLVTEAHQLTAQLVELRRELRKLLGGERVHLGASLLVELAPIVHELSARLHLLGRKVLDLFR
jgi:hypothetical protein